MYRGGAIGKLSKDASSWKRNCDTVAGKKEEWERESGSLASLRFYGSSSSIMRRKSTIKPVSRRGKTTPFLKHCVHRSLRQKEREDRWALDEDTSGRRSKIDSFMMGNFFINALLSSNFFFLPLWKLIIQMLILFIYKITIIIIFFLQEGFIISNRFY